MEEQGKTVSALDEQPILNDVEKYYLEAFTFLSPMRNSGMGLAAISINNISEYYSIFDAPHTLRFFARVMREIDGRFINAWQEKNKER